MVMISRVALALLVCIRMVTSVSDTDSVQVPAHDCGGTTVIGSGYDPVTFDCAAGAFEVLQNCTTAPDEMTKDAGACLFGAPDYTGGTQLLDKKITKADEVSSQLNIAASIEGSGWGAKMSASANYMSSHTSSSQSVTFLIGSTGQVYKNTIGNDANMKMNYAAKATLMNDYKNFLNVYGTHYISTQYQSATFIGSARVFMTKTTGTTELNAAMSMSYSDAFSVSGSASIHDLVQESHMSIDSEASMRYYGKLHKIDPGKDMMVTLNESFIQWQNDTRANPQEQSTPARMVLKPYVSVIEVADIVFNRFNETGQFKTKKEMEDAQAAFYQGTVAAEVVEDLEIETVRAKAAQKAIQDASGFDLFKEPYFAEQKAALANLTSEIGAHVLKIETLSASDVLDLQNQILAMNDSFLQATHSYYTDKLDNIMISMQSYCPRVVEYMPGTFSDQCKECTCDPHKNSKITCTCETYENGEMSWQNTTLDLETCDGTAYTFGLRSNNGVLTCTSDCFSWPMQAMTTASEPMVQYTGPLDVMQAFCTLHDDCKALTCAPDESSVQGTLACYPMKSLLMQTSSSEDTYVKQDNCGVPLKNMGWDCSQNCAGGKQCDWCGYQGFCCTKNPSGEYDDHCSDIAPLTCRGPFEGRVADATNCPDIDNEYECLMHTDTRSDWASACGWCCGKECGGGSSHRCEPVNWLYEKGIKVYETAVGNGTGCPSVPLSTAECPTILDEVTCIHSKESREGGWTGSPCAWCCGEDCNSNGNKCEPVKYLEEQGITEYTDDEGVNNCPGASPSEPPVFEAPGVERCTTVDLQWRGKSYNKKASSAVKCYEKCLENFGMPEGKKCKAWTYAEGAKKACRMFTKNKETKAKSGVLSGKKNCHPELGKIKPSKALASRLLESESSI